LVVENRTEEALQLLTDFAQQQMQTAATDAERAKALLQLGSLATAAGFHHKAEEWYRQLLTIAPNSYVLLAKSLIDQEKAGDAVEVCLRAARDRPSAEVATVLSQLLSSSETDPGLDRRVRPLIASALQTDGDNIELLMSVAVCHVTEDEYDEAIKLFRRILKLQPNNTLALNNLATLLAEGPDQLGEARKYVEQAMAIDGRSPALLDTLGTILIRSGQAQNAVAVLEEAVAGAADDPRYYFHLAVAYHRAGRKADAEEALATSRRYGLDRAILTSGDRELLATLKNGLLTASFQN
jgi:tetratricopeptide (TPR) repeat protein